MTKGKDYRALYIRMNVRYRDAFIGMIEPSPQHQRASDSKNSNSLIYDAQILRSTAMYVHAPITRHCHYRAEDEHAFSTTRNPIPPPPSTISAPTTSNERTSFAPTRAVADAKEEPRSPSPQTTPPRKPNPRMSDSPRGARKLPAATAAVASAGFSTIPSPSWLR